MNKIELRPAFPGSGDGLLSVFRDDDYQGDIERLGDGTWIGDVTLGVFAPSEPFPSKCEAVWYVLDGWRNIPIPNGFHA